MDRRINKTKVLLKNTLTTLLEEKDLRKITVKELTERANVNRGTFYLHYLDIYDMVKKLEDEVMENLMAIVEENNPFNMNYYYLPALLKAVEYIYQDMRFYKALIGPNGDIGFLEKLKKAMVEHTFKSYKTLNKQRDKVFIQYLTIFIVSGGIGALQEWFNHDCITPLQSVIEPCEMIISNGIRNI